MYSSTCCYHIIKIFSLRSVVIPTDRPATGPVRGRRSPFVGVGDIDDGRAAPAGPEFISQFPYKSCQRTKSPRKMTGHKWPYDKPPGNVPQRKVSVKRKKYAGRTFNFYFGV